MLARTTTAIVRPLRGYPGRSPFYDQHGNPGWPLVQRSLNNWGQVISRVSNWEMSSQLWEQPNANIELRSQVHLYVTPDEYRVEINEWPFSHNLGKHWFKMLQYFLMVLMWITQVLQCKYIHPSTVFSQEADIRIFPLWRLRLNDNIFIRGKS